MKEIIRKISGAPNICDKSCIFKVFETVLKSDQDYDNPFWDVSTKVNFVSPSGKEKSVDAFWDGDRTWRVRFCPDEVGEWQWCSECSDHSNTTLHGQEVATVVVNL